MVSAEDCIVCEPACASGFASLTNDEAHVCKHIPNSLGVCLSYNVEKEDRWNELLATAAVAGISAMRGISDRGARETREWWARGGGGSRGCNLDCLAHISLVY